MSVRARARACARVFPLSVNLSQSVYNRARYYTDFGQERLGEIYEKSRIEGVHIKQKYNNPLDKPKKKLRKRRACRDKCSVLFVRTK